MTVKIDKFSLILIEVYIISTCLSDFNNLAYWVEPREWEQTYPIVELAIIFIHKHKLHMKIEGVCVWCKHYAHSHTSCTNLCSEFKWNKRWSGTIKAFKGHVIYETICMQIFKLNNEYINDKWWRIIILL